MKIALCSVYYYTNAWNKSGTYATSSPLGLGYIASYLIKNGHDVKILDDNVLSINQLKSEISCFNPDIVGFTTYTVSAKNSFLIAEWVKESNPNIKVVLGGPHATYLPAETLAHGCVDIVVSGEGEETMVELSEKLTKGESLRGVKGVLYKDEKGHIIDNGPRPLIKDLDSMLFPAHELFAIDKYRGSVFRKFSNNSLSSIITSRGCPHRCTFCSHKMFGSKVRFRSAENVIDEMQLLFENFKVKEFYFLDDTFTLNKKRVMDICDLLLKRGLNIDWSCNLRVNNASEELFLKMKEAGCKGVLIGAESASQEVLDLMKKDITVGQIVHAVALAKKYFENVLCSFIFGMPGDTLEGAYKTIEFAKKIDPDYADFFIATPLPGSELYDQAVERKLIDKKKMGGSGEVVMTYGMEVVVEMSGIKKEDLIMLVKKAHSKFYFRLSYILKRLSKIRSTITIYHYILGVRKVIRSQFVSDKNLFKSKYQS